jgi:hypothetical protein
MSNNQKLLTHLLKNGKGERSWEELAREFGLPSGNAARHTWRKYKKGDQLPGEFTKRVSEQVETANYIADLEEKVVSYMEDAKKGEAELTLKSKEEIRTLEELIQKTSIDTEKWEITKYVQNYWGNSDQPHWQVKAWLSKKQINQAEVIEKVLYNYVPNYIPFTKSHIILNEVFCRPCSAFIDLTDFHLDKKEVTGSNVQQKIENYLPILDKLLFQSYRAHYLDEIVFIVGSDLFHTDTFFKTTTNGTPQDVLIEWDEAYELAFDLHVKVINKLKQFCNKLKVILVQGNHDRTKSFYLAHSLSKYFSPDQFIEFDIKRQNRKVYTYGNTFIGLHHGNCKIDELPLTFAKEFAPIWGSCRYHEVKVGDKHFYYEKEIKGVRIKQLPSLSDPDRWHDDGNYVQNIRAGICTIYDKDKGKVTEFEERI